MITPIVTSVFTFLTQNGIVRMSKEMTLLLEIRKIILGSRLETKLLQPLKLGGGTSK